MRNHPPFSFHLSRGALLRLQAHLSKVSCIGMALAALLSPAVSQGHGALENGRMLQVRLAGANGRAPAPWNDSYYTWNQDSQNFPGYAAAGFSYATTVPDGTIASAGINDGVQTGLNFSGLNNASPNWQQTVATAGGTVRLHWLATASHDPSHFLVYATKASVNPDTKILAWADLELLGSWRVGDANRPVTTSTRANPVSGGTMPSYDWDVMVPADRSGHVALLVIWQRDDPAGEAFFSVQDLKVGPVAAAPQLALGRATNGGINLDLHGVPGQIYDLQATGSLTGPVWTTLATGTPDVTGHWLTSDPAAASYPQRFYRAAARP